MDKRNQEPLTLYPVTLGMPAKVLTDFPGPWQMCTRTVMHMYFSRDGEQGVQLSQKQRIYMV